MFMFTITEKVSHSGNPARSPGQASTAASGRKLRFLANVDPIDVQRVRWEGMRPWYFFPHRIHAIGILNYICLIIFCHFRYSK